jgi:regulator of sigma E protease
MHILLVLLEFAIVLGIMVLVHELGHFLVAKACGVRVEVFSIGFGTRLFGVKRGDTDYRISMLPLGGYVKMAGEYGTEASASAPDDLNSKPRWQRCLIALAGPFSNFILAFLLLLVVAHFHHEVDQYLTGPAVVDYVPANTPAARDGMAAGDTILSFNNVANPTWERVLEECALNLHRSLPITFAHRGQPVTRELNIDTGENSSELTQAGILALGLIPREQPGPVGVLKIEPGTPAARAGLQAGDEVTRIDALDLHSVRTLLAYLKDRDGAPATLQIVRHGQPMTLQATPEKLESPGAPTQFRLGFSPSLPPTDVVKLPWPEDLHQSLKDTRNDSTLILRVLQGMLTRHVSVKSVSGPVGIAQQIDLATQSDFPWTLFRLMSTISLNLGIFNLLPFPPLDGGMIFFLLIESILRRDVNQTIKDRIYQVAFVCVIFLAIFVMFNDISKLLPGRP